MQVFNVREATMASVCVEMLAGAWFLLAVVAMVRGEASPLPENNGRGEDGAGSQARSKLF